MSDDPAISSTATPRTPRRLLEELLAAARPAQPEVELYLAGGQILRGRLAALGDDGGVAVATVVTGGQPRAPAIACVRLDHVVAAIAADASVLVRRAAPPAEPAPTKLELARALGARSESLVTALGRALPMTTAADLDDDGRRAVAAALPALVDSLRAISRDAARKEALDALSGVELGVAAQPELRRDGARLVVIAPRLPHDAWPAARLRAELDKLL